MRDESLKFRYVFEAIWHQILLMLCLLSDLLRISDTASDCRFDFGLSVKTMSGLYRSRSMRCFDYKKWKEIFCFKLCLITWLGLWFNHWNSHFSSHCVYKCLLIPNYSMCWSNWSHLLITWFSNFTTWFPWHGFCPSYNVILYIQGWAFICCCTYCTWWSCLHVGLKKANNKIWFQDGWQEFVNRSSIRIGFLLIFRFKVTVFIFNLLSTLWDQLPF